MQMLVGKSVIWKKKKNPSVWNNQVRAASDFYVTEAETLAENICSIISIGINFAITTRNKKQFSLVTDGKEID